MDKQKNLLTRRRVLKGSLAGWLTAGMVPFAIGKEKPLVRVLGTHVTLQLATFEQTFSQYAREQATARWGRVGLTIKLINNVGNIRFCNLAALIDQQRFNSLATGDCHFLSGQLVYLALIGLVGQSRVLGTHRR